MKVEIKGEKIMKFAEKIDAEYHLSSCPDSTHLFKALVYFGNYQFNS